MAKQPVPEPARRLAQRTVPNSLPRPQINCIACNWRKAANDHMKKAMAENEALEGYTGFTYGLSNGGFILQQFHLGRQIAAVTVPIEKVPDLLNSIADYIANAALAMAPEGEVTDDETEEESNGEEEEAEA